jgi:hypothetical protein
MIWLTWRQHRMQLLFGAVALGLITAFMLPTGLGIWHGFRSTGLAGCLAVPGRDCNSLADAFLHRYSGLQFTVPLFLILPALVGVFWGAPLVAWEVEQGTHRLAWTQSVTRLRWMSTKVVALAAVTVVGAAMMSFLLSWWSRPLVSASDNRMSSGVFDLRGVVPVAYALFALAAGVAAGVLIRRTVAAIAATIGVYTAVRVGVELWARPHYGGAKTISYPLFAPWPRAGLGDWVLSTHTVDRAGHFLANGQALDNNVLHARCPGLPAPGIGIPGKDSALQACVQRLGIHVQATYQPGSRYWLFQGIESAIFVALACGLLAFAVWWVRRRVA